MSPSNTGQYTLFSIAESPEGLRYEPEFISPEVEKHLISHIRQLPLQPFQFGQYEGKRRVASFGFRYDFALRKMLSADPIPEWLTPTIRRVEEFGGKDTKIGQ